jgi:hypothetical protein
VELHLRGERNNFLLSRVLRAPRQCPLLLLVEIYLREGEDLGSEKL